MTNLKKLANFFKMRYPWHSSFKLLSLQKSFLTNVNWKSFLKHSFSLLPLIMIYMLRTILFHSDGWQSCNQIYTGTRVDLFFKLPCSYMYGQIVIVTMNKVHCVHSINPVVIMYSERLFLWSLLFSGIRKGHCSWSQWNDQARTYCWSDGMGKWSINCSLLSILSLSQPCLMASDAAVTFQSEDEIMQCDHFTYKSSSRALSNGTTVCYAVWGSSKSCWPFICCLAFFFSLLSFRWQTSYPKSLLN